MWLGEMLLYGGAALMAAALAALAVSLFLLRRSGKRLEKRLEREYGEKRCQEDKK